jgi:UDP-N-acetylmuramoyl-tripeptide--D-alanyl-D-alanine ligase
LDDAYNANADSTIAALETLCDLPLQGRRVAVLGDMEELGAHSESAHAEVGRRAAELKIGQLFRSEKWRRSWQRRRVTAVEPRD